jgi:uncharacterized repeat protein (TIGR01451 family)
LKNFGGPGAQSQSGAAAGAFPPSDNFAVLASTYTNSAATTITGDLGYTTGPGVAPTVVGGTSHVADGAYTQGGTNEASMLSTLNAQACDFNFGSPTDLSLLSQPLLPGVYCLAAATSIGSGGITLTGSGTYTFRITGALTTVANSVVTLSSGVSACDVFWTPTAATTLGDNSTFVGTDIDDSGISIGNTVGWTGRALAFGGTITSTNDTISTPNCTLAPATLHVIKHVVNDNGGVATANAWTLTLTSSNSGTGTGGAVGAESPGTTYTLQAGKAYSVAESGGPSGYTASLSSNCTIANAVSGTSYTCTITNDDIAPSPPVVSSGGGGGGGVEFVPLIGILKVPTPLSLPAGSGSVTYNYTVWNVAGQKPLTTVTVTDDKCAPVTLLSGDVNSNSKLDPGEHWNYSCTSTLATTTTNTAVAIGFSDDSTHLRAIATAIATVAVGVPIPPPLISIVKVPDRLTPFPFGGGNVLYTYTVTNPGVVAMNNVLVIDDKCAPVSFISGDTNHDALLDPSETWTYTCQTNVPVSTLNIATATGKANGFTAVSYAFATVLVSLPTLPDTGYPPQGETTR